MLTRNTLCSLVMLVSLLGCGGGGGGSTSPGPIIVDPPSNNQPVASSGADQTVNVGDTVSLSGTGSTDADGDSLTYTWQFDSQPTGSNANFTDVSGATTTFVADIAGSYVVSLQVNDGQLNSAADTVTITATVVNNAPTANAGSDQSAVVGDTVTLSGSASQDTDGDTLTYAWQFEASPDGSAATLSDPTAESPSFIADIAGTYSLSLMVNDGQLDSTADTVSITIVEPNNIPVANAGSDSDVIVGNTVSLSGAASSDADGDDLTYTWQFDSIPSDSAATLSNATSITPSFIVDVPGNFVVNLVVNDGQVNSSSDTVTISATIPNKAPVANAGSDGTATLGDTVNLSGASSSDEDGDTLSYVWQLTSVPEGSTTSLTNASSVTPSFVADAAGSFVITLVVNDGQLNSETDAVTITVTQPNRTPVANAGEDATTSAGNTINLSGVASSDADEDTLTYSWAIDSKPSGSTATLSNSTTVSPSFVADIEGSYVISLVVNDGQERSSADTVTITVTQATGTPVANAGPDSTAVAGDTVALSGSGSTGENLTYSWRIDTKPGDSTTSLTNETTVSPSFIADVAGNYVISLVVRSGDLSSETDTVAIAVSAANVAPVADAGSDSTSVVGNTVSLSGAGSTDNEGDTLTYLWQFDSRPDGSAAALTDTTIVSPSFIPDIAGSYVVSLMVNDGQNDSNADTVTITVSATNNAPTANAGSDNTAEVGETVSLSGSASSDDDGDTLTYVWQFDSRPDSSGISLSGSTTVSPSFAPDVAGNYVISLVVNDGQKDSAADTVTITVTNSNTTPTANAGSDISVTVGETVTLSGSDSSDGDGDTLTYTWQFNSTPDGSIVSLRNGTTVSPSFLPDVAGSYVLSLVVNDGKINSSADTVTITAVPANNIPVANAGSDSSVTIGTTVTLSGADSSDADGDPLTYAWTLTTTPDGSTTTLSNSTNVSPTFVPDVVGSYVVSLLVNDGKDNSSADTVTITGQNSSGSFTQGVATTTVTNLFSSGTRVAALGTITDTSNVQSKVATTWTVPAEVRYTDSAMPTASDLHNVYVTGHDYSSATLALADLDGTDVIEIDSAGEIITAYIFADNYFEMYVNGVAVGKDPVPFTDFNSNIIRFKVQQPFTVAMLLVDWEENLGTGTEENGGDSFHPGDGGMVAVFKDSNGDIIGVTDNSWKAQTYYTAPIADTSCLSESNNQRLSTSCSTSAPNSITNITGVHWSRPDNWTTSSFDDSDWPSAVTFSNDTVGVDNKASYTNFTDVFDDSTSDAQFIWSSNLVLDNEILVRASIGTSSFAVTSKALKTDLILPFSATCDGINKGSMIPLTWTDAPSGTNSFAMTMLNYPNPDDAPDVTKAHGYVVLYDIPPETTTLADGQTSIGTFGINSIDGEQTFSAPCSKDPISNDYSIIVYALSNAVGSLDLEANGADLSALSTAISSTTLGSATLTLSKVRYNPNNDDHVPTSVPSDCDTKSAAFTAYSNLVSVSCDSTTMTVTTKTMLPYRSSLDGDKPDVGIKSWIGRVAIAEEASWTLPLQPTYLSTVTSNVNIHDAIGISVEGVPILHYAKEASNDEVAQVGTDYSSRDTVLLGEIDQCGAHAGNGEDYHYHTAPICLMDTHDPSQPLAYMFDGIPLYFGTGGGVLTTDGTDYGAGRYSELDYRPQNVKTGDRALDECNAYDVNGDGSEYVYYSSSAAPYTIACYRGEADQSSSVSAGPHWTEERDLAWAGSDVELTDHDTMTFDSATWTFVEITPGEGNNNIPSGNKALIMYRQLVEGDSGYDSASNCYTFRYRLDSTDTDGSDDTVSTHCR